MALGLTVPERTRRVVGSDLEIEALGPCAYPTPLAHRIAHETIHYVGRADRVLLDDRLSGVLAHEGSMSTAPAFELAGPRHQVFFEPAALRAGIVTCGGLCPGLNNVVRGLVLELTQGYGVSEVLGFRYGYEGLVRRHGLGPVRLTPATVADIHTQGGTILGTSRGEQDPDEVVDRLEELGVRVLFTIGGDGTFRGAMAIVAAIARRRLSIAVVGIPKTIDNDIHFIDRSFGFETAFSAAVEVIQSAHVEATGARNGVGVVKLMGRHSGFIACHAALASTDVDAVLIPELAFRLEGTNGLFEFLEARLEAQSHAVLVVAEGAGQEHCESGGGPPSTDRSGNQRLADIGVVLRERIARYFEGRRTDVTLKYIDPSYHIRSVPASPADSVYCWNMARNAVHAALAGNTNMLIGRWHNRFVHVPMPLATRFRKQVDTTGDLWSSVIESTRQPFAFA
ncbi:MAG TPA: ATP-dependent 6-phosphofructokinase [Polyangiaceae bacterium]|jgi:6-phosphofructokinase 1|nr:ATP-dependent 6-phosphofructokinase [Polyangiaceae bacterium]